MASQISDPVTMGKELARAGRKQEAYQLLRRALYAVGDDPEVRFWLAAVSPTPAEAVEHLQKCLEMEPENERARSGLQWARQQLVNWEARQAEAAAAVPVEQHYATPPAPQFGAAPLGFGNDLPPLPEPSYTPPAYTPARGTAGLNRAPDMAAINEQWPGLTLSQPSYDPPPTASAWPQPEAAAAPAALPDSSQLWGDMPAYGAAPTPANMPSSEQAAYLPAAPIFGGASFATPDGSGDADGFDMMAAAEAHSAYDPAAEPQAAATPYADNSVPANVAATNAAAAVEPLRKPDTGPFKRPSLTPISCRKCGAVARAQDRFCQSCGQVLAEQPDAAEPGGEKALAPLALPPNMPDPGQAMTDGPQKLGNKLSLLNKSRGGDAKVPFAPDKVRQEGAKKPLKRGVLIGATALVLLLALVFGAMKMLGSNSGANAAAAPVAQPTAAADQAAVVAGATTVEPTATVWTAAMSAAATITAVAGAQATVTAAAAATAQTEANEFGRQMSSLLSDVDSQDAEFERALAGYRGNPDDYSTTVEKLDGIMRQNDVYKKQLAKMKAPDAQHHQYVEITAAIGHRGEALTNAGKLIDLVYQLTLLAQATTAASNKYQTALNHYNSTKKSADYSDVVRTKNAYSDLKDQLDRQLTYADQTGKKYDQEWNDYRDLVPAMEKEQLH